MSRKGASEPGVIDRPDQHALAEETRAAFRCCQADDFVRLTDVGNHPREESEPAIEGRLVPFSLQDQLHSAFTSRYSQPTMDSRNPLPASAPTAGSQPEPSGEKP